MENSSATFARHPLYPCGTHALARLSRALERAFVGASPIQECRLQERPTKSRVPHKSFPRERPTRVSSTRVPYSRLSYESPQECSTRAAHKSVARDYQSVSYKSVAQECPPRVFHESTPQEPSRVFHKSVLHLLQERLLQECPARVSLTRVADVCPTRPFVFERAWAFGVVGFIFLRPRVVI